MNELDEYLASYAERYSHVDEHHNPCSEYIKADYQVKAAKKRIKSATDKDERKTAVKALKKAQQKRATVHCYPAKDLKYTRLVFNRYADDFIVGIIGSKEDALRIKADIKEFLTKRLKLTLSEEKTKVTHASEKVRHLGYDFCIFHSKDLSRDKNGVLKRSQYGTVKLYVPHEKWRNKLLELGAMKTVWDEGNKREIWIPLHRGELQNLTDVEIISKYNSEIRGLYNFYRLANNASVLNQFDFIMQGSLHKTFAFKYRTTANAMRKKYMENGIFGAYYQTKQGIKRCESYHDGFRRCNIPLLEGIDVLPVYKRLPKTNSLKRRIMSGVCELCGKENVTIHMHHVKKLKDLQGNTAIERKMRDMRRRSIALCLDCFAELTGD